MKKLKNKTVAHWNPPSYSKPEKYVKTTVIKASEPAALDVDAHSSVMAVHDDITHTKYKYNGADYFHMFQKAALKAKAANAAVAKEMSAVAKEMSGINDFGLRFGRRPIQTRHDRAVMMVKGSKKKSRTALMVEFAEKEVERIETSAAANWKFICGALKNRDEHLRQQAKELNKLREACLELQQQIDKGQQQRECILAASLVGVEHSRHFREL